MSKVIEAYSVSELTAYIKLKLEDDDLLQNVWVEGEISNLVKHSSGHHYFTLKDNGSSLGCVMFKGENKRVSFSLENGTKVKARGRIALYPPRGSYQLIVSDVKQDGIGDLYVRFEELKMKLEAEGLFSESLKRPIPSIPKKIGIATSETGAAVKDVIRTIDRRFPHVDVILAPTTVQGESGADSIVHSLELLNKIAELDVILLCRGGGSIEDLWNFNEEKVARAIRSSDVPIISGVGHETDFTIADFVADMRASTPTAAAEHAVPEVSGILGELDNASQRIEKNLRYFVDFRKQVLDELSTSIQRVIINNVVSRKNLLESIENQLSALNMKIILKRGFTVTKQGGSIVSKSEDIRKGEVLQTVFWDGTVNSKVSKVVKNG